MNKKRRWQKSAASGGGFLFAAGRDKSHHAMLKCRFQNEKAFSKAGEIGVTPGALVCQKFCRRFLLAMAVCCPALLAKNVCGQEALRVSLAGDLAAESNRQAENSTGYYNLLLEPMAWRFSSGLGLEYNDNIRRAQNNPEGDFIFRPNADARLHWPVTEKNSLDFSLGIGYSAYLQHGDLDQLYISPGSGVSFDIYAGDWVFNLHDRVSITENTYETSGVNGNNARLENVIGASGLWDLNKVVLRLGYDHANDVSLTPVAGQSDSATENFFAFGGVRISPEIMTGLEAGGGLVNYSQSVAPATPDAVQWNAGVFSSVQASEYISARLDAGYTVYMPDAASAGTATAGYYFQFSASHRVNQFVSYTLSAGRSTDSSYYGQPQSYYFARVQPDWNIFEKIRLSTPFWWQQGTPIYSGHANYDQFGFGINLNRQITKKLSGGLSYQFEKEILNQPGLNYMVNIVGLNFSYQF